MLYSRLPGPGTGSLGPAASDQAARAGPQLPPRRSLQKMRRIPSTCKFLGIRIRKTSGFEAFQRTPVESKPSVSMEIPFQLSNRSRCDVTSVTANFRSSTTTRIFDALVLRRPAMMRSLCSKSDIYVSVLSTPNPNALKFIPGCDVTQDPSRTLTLRKESFAESNVLDPLCEQLLALDGVNSVTESIQSADIVCCWLT